MSFGFRVLYGQYEPEPLIEIEGVVDLAAGRGSVLFTRRDAPGIVQQRVIDGADLYVQFSGQDPGDPELWHCLRKGKPGELPLTDELFGFLSLARAAVRAGLGRRDGLPDGAPVTRFDLRLGSVRKWNDGAVLLVLGQRLPRAFLRRRIAQLALDEMGRVREMALTTSGPPRIRYQQKWLVLRLWDFGREIHVPRVAPDSVLRGGPLDQVRQMAQARRYGT